MDLMGLLQDPMFQLGTGLLAQGDGQLGQVARGVNQFNRQQQYNQAFKQDQEMRKMELELKRRQMNAPAIRKYETDVNGVKRYVDDGSQVFQGVSKQQKPHELTQLYQAAQNEPVGSPLRTHYENLIKKKTTSTPLVQNNIGGESNFKVPTGYMVDPSNPMRVIPIAGGDKDPSNPKAVEKERAQFREEEYMLNQLEQSIGKLSNSVDENGTEIMPNLFSGGKKQEMSALHVDALMQVKELYKLGALQAPDIAILEKLLVDPTSVSGVMTGPEGIQSSLTVLNDMVSRARANLKTKYPQAGGGSVMGEADKILEGLGL